MSENSIKKLKGIIPYIIILVVVVLLRTFIITPVMVNGPSMNDTLSHNNIILLKKYTRSYQRNDIVIFRYNDTQLVKRVIGLPGEKVEYKDGVLYINNVEVEDRFASITADFNMSMINLDVIPQGHYFVLGDNRPASSDSRIMGPISEERIVGSSSFSIWPIGRIR